MPLSEMEVMENVSESCTVISTLLSYHSIQGGFIRLHYIDVDFTDAWMDGRTGGGHPAC